VIGWLPKFQPDYPGPNDWAFVGVFTTTLLDFPNFDHFEAIDGIGLWGRVFPANLNMSGVKDL